MDLFAPSAKAASSLLGIFMIGLVGGYYPRALGGVLSANTVRVCAACVLYLQSPALLFSVLGRTLTPALLYDAASAAVWCVITVLVGVGVAFAARVVARPPPAFEGSFLIAIIFSNAMSLPLLLLSSLTARGTLHDDAGAFTRAVSYVFVYTIPWWVLLYSVGLELAHRSAASHAAGGAPRVDATLRAVLSRALLQPPVIAIGVGIIVGLTPLRWLFFGDAAPLAGFGDVATLIGSGSVPSANIVLAGSLYGGCSDAVRDARAWLGDAPPPADASAGAKLLDAMRTLVRAGERAWQEQGARVRGPPDVRLGGGDAPSAPEGGARPSGGRGGGCAAEAVPPLSPPAAASPFSLGGSAARGSTLQLLVRDADDGVDVSALSRDEGGVGAGSSRDGGAAAAADGAAPPLDGLSGEAFSAAPEALAAPAADGGVEGSGSKDASAPVPLALDVVAPDPLAAATRMPFSSIGTILVARLVVVPAVVFALFFAAQVGQVPLLVSDDPVLTLVVLVQAAMPSAQSLLIVTSNVGDTRGTKALSLLFIVQYPLACLVLVPWLMLALEMAGVRGAPDA